MHKECSQILTAPFPGATVAVLWMQTLHSLMRLAGEHMHRIANINSQQFRKSQILTFCFLFKLPDEIAQSKHVRK